MQEETSKEKLSRDRFAEELCKQVLVVLGEGYGTDLSEVRKNNGVMKDVLYIRKEDCECIPCFYMDELYHSYCNGENEIGLAEHLANIVLTECERVREQVTDFLEREWILSHLFVRLIQAESNTEWLQDAVYVEYLDLLAVFYVLTEEADDGVKSYQLPRNVWEALELGSAEEYFPTIVENTRRLFSERLWCVEQSVKECTIEGVPRYVTRLVPLQEHVSAKMYVLSNRRRINGAAVVLYPELLQHLGETFGGDFYVIPSSIHEVFLLTGPEDAGFLNRMIRSVNQQNVPPEEVLSNHVYLYSVKDERLLSVEDLQ